MSSMLDEMMWQGISAGCRRLAANQLETAAGLPGILVDGSYSG